MYFDFIQGIITYFLLEPVLDFFKARLGTTTVAHTVESSLTPLAILIKRYGVFKPALLCATVEVIAHVVNLFLHGVDGSVTRTMPLLESRTKTIFLAAYVFICSHLSSLGWATDKPFKSTAIAQTALHFQEPALRVLHIAQSILKFFFGENYFASHITYFKTLPRRFCNYARRQGKEKIIKPGKRTIRRMRRKYPFIAFACRAAFLVFAVAVFSVSIPVAFLYVCAMDVDAALIDIDEEHSMAFIEEVDFDGAESFCDETTLNVENDDRSSIILSIMGVEGDLDTICDIEDSVVKRYLDMGTEVVVEVAVEEQSVCEERTGEVIMASVLAVEKEAPVEQSEVLGQNVLTHIEHEESLGPVEEPVVELDDHSFHSFVEMNALKIRLRSPMPALTASFSMPSLLTTSFSMPNLLSSPAMTFSFSPSPSTLSSSSPMLTRAQSMPTLSPILSQTIYRWTQSSSVAESPTFSNVSLRRTASFSWPRTLSKTPSPVGSTWSANPRLPRAQQPQTVKAATLLFAPLLWAWSRSPEL
ncbi:hypothetical protein D9613_005639 [Agrocybe pediades]|uniref:Uncharacterized protein n=1 Tax=Agrocybe pediades TaxID=84607 RepID=A0A8H4VPJ1_9AGAR|nr:hypothetical protein D9613_005639 [Agrocybe pediades]